VGVELWTGARAHPGWAAKAATLREREGWDGLFIPDSQNLSGDPYVAMALAAQATSRLRVSTGVTNPVTRHPAVTATAIATVQAESDNRAELGIGRGDSALSHLGLAPAPVDRLRQYVTAVQTYLRGGSVALADAADGATHLIDDRLPHADRPESSTLRWLRRLPERPKPPVFVVASGPRVIRLAAQLADRVTLAVGADPDRIGWGIKIAREVRPDIPVGAFVNVLVDDDDEQALRRAAGTVAAFARFNAMHGTAQGPASERHRATMEAVARGYELTKHNIPSGPHAAELTPEFARRFAILGPAGYCVDRLLEIVELGVDRLFIVGGAAGPRHPVEQRRFVDHVMPALRGQG
jgi:5,10-methylenetetrahydromethanopterin reductase